MFLEVYNLPRLNHEELENLNRLINNKEIKMVIKNTFQKTKLQERMASLVKSTYPFQTSKKLKRREYFLTHFMRPTLH